MANENPLDYVTNKKFDEFSNKTHKRFDKQGKDINSLMHDVLDLKLDAKEAKEERGEMKKLLHMIFESVQALDERVRFQGDLPERVTQLGA
jgi:hypothetical protein